LVAFVVSLESRFELGGRIAQERFATRGLALDEGWRVQERLCQRTAGRNQSGCRDG
jgi:hypothetical protein